MIASLVSRFRERLKALASPKLPPPPAVVADPRHAWKLPKFRATVRTLSRQNGVDLDAPLHSRLGQKGTVEHSSDGRVYLSAAPRIVHHAATVDDKVVQVDSEVTRPMHRVDLIIAQGSTRREKKQNLRLAAKLFNSMRMPPEMVTA